MHPGRSAPVTSAPPDRASAPPRSLAPDLSRGLLLVFIAVANVWGYLYGSPVGIGGRPVDGSTLDRVVDGLVAFAVDDRSRPMFAILFGFGMATIWARTGDPGQARRVLVRRNLALFGLGVLHAALLFGGDILASYGLTGLLVVTLLHRRRAVLVRWFWISLAAMTVGGGALLLLPADQAAPVTGYLVSAVDRVVGDVAGAVVAVVILAFVSQMVLGIGLARAGWLARPAEHRAQLRRVAVVAAVVNLVANLPYALAVATVWTPTGGVHLVVEAAHYVSGVVMGLGYVCVFALLAVRLAGRGRGGVVGAVAALGERSLSGYLAQSVVLAPLLSEWGLGLGGRIGTAQATALAVVVWLTTVAGAMVMARSGRRGPFEVVLRRLTYGDAPSGARALRVSPPGASAWPGRARTRRS